LNVELELLREGLVIRFIVVAVRGLDRSADIGIEHGHSENSPAGVFKGGRLEHAS